jgi:hypothetical protein
MRTALYPLRFQGARLARLIFPLASLSNKVFYFHGLIVYCNGFLYKKPLDIALFRP